MSDTDSSQRASSGPGFGDLVNNLRIAATSPDGYVKATLTMSDGIKVDLRPDANRQHTETTLADTVTTTVRGVLRGYSTAMDKAFAKPPDAEPSPPPSPEQVERLRKYGEAVAGIDVEAISPRRHIKAQWNREGLHVRLRPGVLSRMDVGLEQLTTEVNDAIAHAHSQYRRETRHLKERM